MAENDMVNIHTLYTPILAWLQLIETLPHNLSPIINNFKT